LERPGEYWESCFCNDKWDVNDRGYILGLTGILKWNKERLFVWFLVLGVLGYGTEQMYSHYLIIQVLIE
jgi:hypothetical protein